MHADGRGLTWGVVHTDLFALRDPRDVVEGILVRLAPGVAFRGFVAVVERDTRADDVKHRSAVKAERRLDQLLHLLRIARKGAGDEPAVSRQGLEGDVHRHEWVLADLLELLAPVGGRWELP